MERGHFLSPLKAIAQLVARLEKRHKNMNTTMRISLLVACQDDRLAIAVCQRFKQDTAPSGDRVIDARSIPWRTLLASLGSSRPHVLLLEDRNGLLADLMPTVRRLSPETGVLALCESAPQEAMVSLIKLGLSGCVLASDSASVMAKAVRTVSAGESWFGRGALTQALRSLMPAAATGPLSGNDGAMTVLTHREQQIFRLASLALTNKEIARHLGISDSTVKTHLHSIYVKLHQSGRYKAFLSMLNGRAPADGVVRKGVGDGPLPSS